MFENSTRGSVAIVFVHEILACASRRGVDPLPLAVAAGIPEALLTARHARVSAEVFGQLWLTVAATLDDEFFGLDARRMKVGSYAALCRQAARCATLEEALQATVVWLNLILDESRLTLTREGRDAVLGLHDATHARPPQQRNRVFAHETLLVMTLGLACWLIDRRIPLRALAFAYPRPAHASEYDLIYAPGARFEAKCTHLRFAATVLQAPVVQTSVTLRIFLRAAPANFILRYRNERSPAARVRRRLQALPFNQWPDFSTLARVMGTTTPTLHRQLAREGARFGAIRDALRRDHAIERLSASNMAISQIAEELGYAEPGAFYRAFRRWTGVRPGDYRDTRRRGPPLP